MGVTASQFQVQRSAADHAVAQGFELYGGDTRMKFLKWHIPMQVVNETQQAFLEGRHEVFVMWTAPLRESSTSGDPSLSAEISRCIVPAQRPGVSPSGVWVHIEGSELQRIQIDNYRRRERSIIQLHTHPGSDVRMSELDREWEVVRHPGALSIIVPCYGTRGLASMAGVNVYEREEDDWRLWSQQESTERLVIT